MVDGEQSLATFLTPQQVRKNIEQAVMRLENREWGPVLLQSGVEIWGCKICERSKLDGHSAACQFMLAVKDLKACLVDQWVV